MSYISLKNYKSAILPLLAEIAYLAVKSPILVENPLILGLLEVNQAVIRHN